LVNRGWQAAFEERIYSSLVVLSPSDATSIVVDHEEPCNKHGLILQIFDVSITGSESWKRARKAAIRRVRYQVAVPHWLSDEGVDDDEEFAHDNAFRRQNDEAFSKGIRSLFGYLSQ
jgi:hypothetical protein